MAGDGDRRKIVEHMEKKLQTSDARAVAFEGEKEQGKTTVNSITTGFDWWGAEVIR